MFRNSFNMRFHFAYVLLVTGFVTSPIHAASRYNRMPEVPKWRQDVTGKMGKIMGKVSSTEDVLKAKVLPYQQAISRQSEANRVIPRGETVWWRAELTIPDKAKVGEALVIQFDNVKILEDIWINGKKFGSSDSLATGDRTEGTEGIYNLPALKAGEHFTLILKLRELTHLYQNAFGRVIIRPASINERLSFGRLQKRGKIKADLLNHTFQSQQGKIQITKTNFFGTLLETQVLDFSLKPKASKRIEWNQNSDKDTVWKVELLIKQGDHSSFPYWKYPDSVRYNVVRDDYVRLPANDWKIAPAPTKKEFAYPLPKDDWKTIKLPYRPKPEECPTHKMWYTHSIKIPANFAGKRICLFLQHLVQKGEIFIDGKKVGQLYRWQTPGTVDITDYVRPGKTHELAIGITDFIVCLRPGLEIPADNVKTASAETLAGPIGYLPRQGTPALREVPELWALPPVRVDQAVIRTQVEGKKEIKVLLTFSNDTKTETSATLSTEIYDKGKKVKELPEINVALPPGKTIKSTINSAWQDAILWSLENPHLYEMRLVLKDADGKSLDSRKERFGFRQFGIKGRMFTLNGKIFKPYGSGHQVAWHNTWPYIPATQRVFRHHFKTAKGFTSGICNNWIADEMGVLIKDENLSHNAHHGRRFAYDLGLTFDRAFSETQSVYNLRPNNPSTWIWDLGNELNFHPRDEEIRWGKYYGRVKEMDPTRLVTNSGGGGTPRGPKVELYDTHYNTAPFSKWTWWYTHPEERPDYMREKDYKFYSAYIPKGAGEDPKEAWEELANIGVAKRGTTGGRPMLFSESLNCDSFIAYSLAGDQCYRPVPCKVGTWSEKFASAYMDWQAKRKYMIEMNRQAELAGWLCHINRAYGRAQYPIAAFPLDRSLRFFATQPINLRFTLHNDREQTEKLTVTWTLLDGEKTIAEKKETLDVKAAEVKEIKLTLAAPSTVPAGDYDLVWTVQSENGDAFFTDYARLSVLKKPVIPSQNYVVFDPKETLKDIIPASVKRITDISAWKSKTPLLIASRALDHVKMNKLGVLRDMITNGGKVLILDQNEIPSFLDEQPNYQKKRFNTAMPVDPFSPLTKGCIESDFRFWRTADFDDVVVLGLFTIPRRGNFRTHLFSGKGSEITDSPLLEMAAGKGRVMMCQLNLLRALGHEPMADIILERMINWLTGPDNKKDAKSVFLAVDDQSKAENIVNRMFLDTDIINDLTKLNDVNNLIINGTDSGALKKLEEQAEAVKTFVSKGGDLIVLNLTPDNAAKLSAILGKDINVSPFAFGQTFISQYDELLQGITNSDLVWDHGNSKGMYQNLTCKNEKPKREHTGHFKFGGNDVELLCTPAYLGLVRMGKGRIILNNVRSMDYPIPAASRVMAMMFNNAGVPVLDSIRKKDKNTDKWAFSFVDIRPFCNRQFKDEYGAKVRGWQAEGPDSDLRMMPVGKQNFKGVKFDIINPKTNHDKSLIALSGTKERNVLPEKIEGIKVNRKADRLIFLYGSCWGDCGFQFKVWYEDRKHWLPTEPDPFEIVNIKPKEDIMDWTNAGKVESGHIFMAGGQAAWTAPAPWNKNTLIGLFMKVWENPHPEKVIESIDIISPGTSGKGQPFILAITAADTKEAVLKKKVDPKNNELLHFKNSRYGAILLRNGCLPLIHNSQGLPLFNFSGWYSQGMIRNTDTKNVRFKEFGKQSELKTATVEQKIDKKGNLSYIFKSKQANADITEAVVFAPNTIEINYDFMITRDVDPKWNPNYFISLKNLAPGLDEKIFLQPNLNPIRVLTKAGLSEIRFTKKWRSWYSGYWLKDNCMQFIVFQKKRHKNTRASLRLTIKLP